MGACNCKNSNSDFGELEKCSEAGDSFHENCSPSITQETTEACRKEKGILQILEHRSLSILKVSAIKKEHALSFTDFCKPTYVRDQTECKETFKAIEAEGNWRTKQHMLDQALEYFTANAEGKREFYYAKLGAPCPTNEEAQCVELEKTIRSAERKRWSNVKTQQELSVNDLEFVTYDGHFIVFKRSLATSVHISYPFTAEQIQCRSWWKDNSMIIAYDANKAVFPLSKYELIPDAKAIKPENMFTEASVKVDPATLREQIHANKDAVNTGLDEKRCADGLNAWDMLEEGVGLSDTELGVFKTFWEPTEKFALNTALDEERVASGLNEWDMFDTDIIKNDVCTNKQEGIIASRSSRGPLSSKLISRRLSQLMEYFSKHKFIQRRIDAPAAIFFAERVEVQTPSDYAAVVKKHHDLDAAFFATLVTEGAPFTEIFGNQKQFKFKSPEAKTLMDKRMALRASERAGKM